MFNLPMFHELARVSDLFNNPRNNGPERVRPQSTEPAVKQAQLW
jgi:hypothetical protein